MEGQVEGKIEKLRLKNEKGVYPGKREQTAARFTVNFKKPLVVRLRGFFVLNFFANF